MRILVITFYPTLWLWPLSKGRVETLTGFWATVPYRAVDVIFPQRLGYAPFSWVAMWNEWDLPSTNTCFMDWWHFFFLLCSARPGAENVQDTGASFSGWSESNYTLGEADEQVLSMLLAESASYDPLLDNIDWGDDTYSGEMNLNPD